MICGLSSARLVIMAALMTLCVTLALTIYAFTTSTDFTTLGGALYVFCSILLLFSFFALFTNNNVVHIALCAVSIFMYGMYLVYDT